MSLPTPHGYGRNIPASSATQNGFVQESTNPADPNGLRLATPAQVLAALTQIDAAAEVAAGNIFTGQVSTITQSTTAKPGGVYFAAASITLANAVTLTLPSAAAAVTIAGTSNRQITLMNLSSAVTVWAGAASDHINGAGSSAIAPNVFAHEKYDTDGSHWYKI